MKEKYCKYCGKQIFPEKGEYHTCSGCSKFLHLGVYRKLGIRTDRSLQEAYREAFSILYNAYFNENCSVLEIYERFGICHTTLKRLFNDFNVKLRDLSTGQVVAVLEGRTVPGKAKQYHTGWHTTWQGVQVFYRSSYELDFAKDLDSKQIPYSMESLRIPYWNSEQGKQRIAIPDFYLPETGELVEIKSRWTYREQEMMDKFVEYRKLGYVPRLILEHREINLVF